MRRTRKSVLPLVLATALPVAMWGCSSEDKAGGGKKKQGPTAPAKKTESKPTPKPKPPARESGEVVLETVDVPYVGKMLLPKGSTSSLMTKTSGHYKFALSTDGWKNLYIDYETVGKARTLKQAQSLASIVAGNAKESAAKTLPSGIHIIERKRDKDKKIWVIAFRPKGYVKCWGPADQLENCRKIAASVPMPSK